MVKCHLICLLIIITKKPFEKYTYIILIFKHKHNKKIYNLYIIIIDFMGK